MTDNRFEVFTSCITQILKSIQKLKDRGMLPFGLRGGHVMCLFHLRKAPQGLTAAALSELCGLDKAAVSRLLADLERRGVVACPKPAEKRKYRAMVSLTEDGTILTSRIAGMIEQYVERAGAGLDTEERETFYRALLLITQNLKNMAAD